MKQDYKNIIITTTVPLRDTLRMASEAPNMIIKCT